MDLNPPFKEVDMRFLDIDLDFFLNRNAYYSGKDTLRLGDEYKPWSHLRVSHFLETKCGLSRAAPIAGRIIESHDLVIRFWQDLIDSGALKMPFEVVHIDAHPDLSVRGGLRLVSNRLYVDHAERLAALEDEYVHSGNYLTFAIAMGWIDSLVWIPLSAELTKRQRSLEPKRARGESLKYLPGFGPGVPFKILSRHSFTARKPFDYMILSRSPAFTPLASDDLIPVISGFMKLI
jgi:hypothetical protein